MVAPIRIWGGVAAPAKSPTIPFSGGRWRWRPSERRDWRGITGSLEARQPGVPFGNFAGESCRKSCPESLIKLRFLPESHFDFLQQSLCRYWQEGPVRIFQTGPDNSTPDCYTPGRIVASSDFTVFSMQGSWLTAASPLRFLRRAEN
jgi:hypothetical protein